MVGVTAALLAAVVVIVLIGIASALRRRLVDERSSVRDYQQTIDTLRHLSDRRRGAEAVPPGPAHEPAAFPQVSPQAPAGGPPPQTTPPQTTPPPPVPALPAPVGAASARHGGAGNGRGSRPAQRRRTSKLIASTSAAAVAEASSGRRAAYARRPGSPPVSMRVPSPPEAADDQTPAVPEAPTTPPPTAPATDPPTDAPAVTPGATPQRVTAAAAVRQLAATGNRYGARPARPSMPGAQRPERRGLLLTVAAVVLVGVVTGVAVAEAPSHPPSARSATTSTSGAHRSSGAGGGQGGKTTSSRTGSSSPGSASPGANGLDPVTSSSSSATYRVSGAPYTVVVATTTGPCWVEATDTTTGRVLWEGTLAPGNSRSIPATAGLLLRLGNSLAASITEGGRSVHLPPGAGDVFDLTFEVL